MAEEVPQKPAGAEHAAEDSSLSTLTAGLPTGDRFTRGWIEQVILRMRRELTWLWRHHHPADRLADALERQSLVEQRRRFFANDPTARYLDERVRAGKLPLRGRSTRRGTFGWLARELDLSSAEVFVVGMALAAARDAAVGSLIAALHGDPRQQLPTLGLAQWLWDDPQSLTSLTSQAHSLFARGILRRDASAGEWSAPIMMPALVAEILQGRAQAAVLELELVAQTAREDSSTSGSQGVLSLEVELLARRMASAPQAMQVVPLTFQFSGDELNSRRAAPTLQRIASITGRPVYSIRENAVLGNEMIESAGTCCWLLGGDLLIPALGARDVAWQNLLRPLPIYVFTSMREDAPPTAASTLPALEIPVLNYTQRRECWQQELSARGLEADLELIRECAYRFRIDAVAIADVVAALSQLDGPVTLDRMMTACQQQVGRLIGTQAVLVAPRFRRQELVLNAQRSAHFDELLTAMRTLSRVHADWGTGQAWGDAGVSALFAGPPGTGKTMAAEVLADALHLPMYRVDLSQVVNKYIGETEKNLRKLFDAAEQADLVLFFDEAEALFGQRTQARNANDRFANMEVSYLLERMERFRGLAILATNRKKDLDEAFLRRLRYVIEFPVPDEAERLTIWNKSIPPQVASENLDMQFLAREFALSGGNIRSIVLNACLQAASTHTSPALNMATMMVAVEREYEKIGRPLTREQKSQWNVMTLPAPRRVAG